MYLQGNPNIVNGTKFGGETRRSLHLEVFKKNVAQKIKT